MIASALRSRVASSVVRRVADPRIALCARPVYVRSASSDSLSWGSAAVELAGVAKDLIANESTIFAPSNEAIQAFAQANPSATSALKSGAGAAAIGAHVIPGKVLKAAEVPEGDNQFNTVAGTPIVVSKSGGKIIVRSGSTSANVIGSDVMAGNAVVHVIDNVLAPGA